jgi:hypothetical protein
MKSFRFSNTTKSWEEKQSGCKAVSRKSFRFSNTKVWGRNKAVAVIRKIV